MNTPKWLIPFGMISVSFFLALTCSGKILWPEYNPVTTYVSALVADGAPNSHLMRIFFNAYNICFCIFSMAMAAHVFKRYGLPVKLGYAVLFVLSFFALLGYGAVPVSLELIFSPQNMFHLFVTIILLSSTILCMALIAAGYLKQERHKRLGCFSLAMCILFTAFNLWHLYAIFHGENILGLIQRLTFYSFHVYTFTISWVYTFRKEAC